jgi:poly-gamma-glutamate synthase PgsB/CapB
MPTLAVPLGALIVLISWFAVERFRHNRALRKIPLRIAVTGTRGKSTVTRIIAAIVRADGRRVVAKTTGSKPVVIFPNGREEEIVRTGKPSILEQKRLVRLAGKLGADTLVVEMMSIRPENLRVESMSLIRPQLLVLTNVRLDHMDDMGRTKEQIAKSLAEAIPPHAKVIVLEEEDFPVFEDVAKRRNSTIARVPKDSGAAAGDFSFAENVRLALAVAEILRIPRETALRGMDMAKPDFGGFKLWTTQHAGRTWLLASAFAANDPESTGRILEKLRRRPGFPARAIALLNLREDRGDRTRQWLDAGRGGFFDGFDQLVFIGDHARAIARKPAAWFGTKARVTAIASADAGKIMGDIFALSPENGLVVGMGNMGGPGEALVNYWEHIGRPA